MLALSVPRRSPSFELTNRFPDFENVPGVERDCGASDRTALPLARSRIVGPGVCHSRPVWTKVCTPSGERVIEPCMAADPNEPGYPAGSAAVVILTSPVAVF